MIGLGSAGTFNLAPGNPEYANGREVIRLFQELGGKVIDTAPSYQRSEVLLAKSSRNWALAKSCSWPPR